MKGAGDTKRALRGIILVLSNDAYLFDFEIQYLLLEFSRTLEESGVLGADHNVPDLIGAIPEGEWGGPVFERAAMQSLADEMGPFARAIEAEARKQGWEILQLNVPFGDSVFYVFMTAQEAEIWRCVTLWEGADSNRAGQTVSFRVHHPIGLSFMIWSALSPLAVVPFLKHRHTRARPHQGSLGRPHTA